MARLNVDKSSWYQRIRPDFDASLLALLLGPALWIVMVSFADFSKMGAYGLVSIVGWPYFVGLSIVVFGFAAELFRTPMRPKRLLAYVIIFVIFIFGTAPAIEPVAALGDSWLHAGFIQYILQHGSVLNSFDARFSWPGGFSLGAVMVALAGQHDALFMLKWFPLFIELMYLAPLLVIGRSSGVGRRAAWLGTILFYASNWIYQDYFSPQALANFLLLVVLATVLSTWQPKVVQMGPTKRWFWGGAKKLPASSAVLVKIDGEDTVPVWQSSESAGVVTATWHRLQASGIRKVLDGLIERLIRSRSILTIDRLEGHDVTTTRSGGQILGLMALLALISLAMAMSHQLTPYALVVMLLGTLVARKLGRPELIFTVALFAVAWLSLGASNYWIGHLSTIFGSVGQISSTVGSNVTSRIVGSPSHRLIVNLRILITFGVYFLAGIGVLRRSTDSRVLEVITGAPILLLVAQSYGGEGLMRVVLFGLPFAALLAASAILPSRQGEIGAVLPLFPNIRHQRRYLQVIVVVAVLCTAFLTTVVRGGNDSYESFSKGELAAVNYVYQHVKIGQTVDIAVSYMPMGQRNVGSISIGAISGGSETPPVHFYQTELVRLRPRWIILSRSQEAWGEFVAGYPKGWIDRLEASLIANGYSVAAHWTTAVVLWIPAL
jgi:hypothetical protein